jgi:hypothetical protein
MERATALGEERLKRDPLEASEPVSKSAEDRMMLTEIVQAAAGLFVRQARIGNDPTRFRMDLYRKVAVPDRVLAALGRQHAVAVRVSITCESMLFDRDGSTSAVLPPVADAWRG